MDPRAPVAQQDPDALREADTRPRTHKYSWKPAAVVVGVGIVAFIGVELVLRRFSGVGLAATTAITWPIAGYFLYLRTKLKLVLDANGVTVVDSKMTRAMPWDDIHDVVYRPGSGVRSKRFDLRCKGETKLSFENEYDEWERALRTIERRVARRLYPWIRDRIERGETVAFGVVEISRSHVRIGKIGAAWETVKLNHNGDHLTLSANGDEGGQPLAIAEEADVPNVALLMRIAAEVDRDSTATKLRGRAARPGG